MNTVYGFDKDNILRFMATPSRIEERWNICDLQENKVFSQPTRKGAEREMEIRGAIFIGYGIERD